VERSEGPGGAIMNGRVETERRQRREGRGRAVLEVVNGISDLERGRERSRERVWRRERSRLWQWLWWEEVFNLRHLLRLSFVRGRGGRMVRSEWASMREVQEEEWAVQSLDRETEFAEGGRGHLLARDGAVSDCGAIPLEMISNIVCEINDRATIIRPAERERERVRRERETDGTERETERQIETDKGRER
jgi:hypothetical protein